MFRVTPFVDRRSSVPLLPNVAFAAPVKAMPAPAVSALVLKSIVPALTRLPPTERTCPVWAPVAADWKIPPAFDGDVAADGERACGRVLVLERRRR